MLSANTRFSPVLRQIHWEWLGSFSNQEAVWVLEVKVAAAVGILVGPPLAPWPCWQHGRVTPGWTGSQPPCGHRLTIFRRIQLWPHLSEWSARVWLAPAWPALPATPETASFFPSGLLVEQCDGALSQPSTGRPVQRLMRPWRGSAWSKRPCRASGEVQRARVHQLLRYLEDPVMQHVAHLSKALSFRLVSQFR